MNKMKIVKNPRISQLIIKSQKGQQLNEREVYAIGNNQVTGLIKVNVIKKKTSFKLVYNITGFTSFKDFFKDPLDKVTFAKLLQSIFANLQSMQDAQFYQQCVLFNINHVLINPSTLKVYFIYVPIQGFTNGIILRDFLLNIIQSCTFSPGEDTSYVREYINILNRGMNFSLFELKEYINGISFSSDKKYEGKKKCPRCSNDVTVGTKYCSLCGAKIVGDTGDINNAAIYTPPINDIENGNNQRSNSYREYNGIGEIQYLREDRTVVRVKPASYEEKEDRSDRNDTQGLSDDTTNLSEADDPYIGGTVVLNEEAMRQPVAYLIRLSTNEKITISKSPFRIGRMKESVDYWVTNNNAVGRKHADVIIKEGRYYLFDLKSKNGTFIDDRRIPEETETEVFSGSRITFADEDYDFIVD